MKKAVCLILSLLLCAFALTALAQAAVPDALPDDLGGKTLYGYLVGLKDEFLPAKVFQDATKYSDENRENARRAATLIISATTAKMQETGTPDQYMLYLRAYASDLLFQAGGEEALREAGLADYRQVIDLGGSYAQADYDRLAALEVKAAPLNWQVPQMLTLAEAAAVLGVAEADLQFVDSGYSTADGSRSGAGYALRTAENPAASVIYVLCDPQGGRARYDVLKTMAVMQLQLPLEGLGDEALMIGVRNVNRNPALYTEILVLQGDLVLQVRVPFAFWSGAPYELNPAEPGMALAQTLLDNLYDAQRAVPSMDGVVMDAPANPPQMNAGTGLSPVPDAMPADLGGKTEYGYLVELRNTYLPASVYNNSALSQTDLNNARRVAQLIADNITARFDTYGLNPYELEIRAACYRFAYQDTGVEAFRALAINDYKQAFSTGYTLGMRDYEELARPLLLPMADLAPGAEGDAVSLLQLWLSQIQMLDTPANGTYDDQTRQAVERFEEEHAFPVDGTADIAVLLSLYALVDDMDAALPK